MNEIKRFWMCNNFATLADCTYATSVGFQPKLEFAIDRYRGHAGLKGETPVATSESRGASLKSYRWRQHCRGLYQTPMAA
jgi:hypothetical protein